VLVVSRTVNSARGMISSLCLTYPPVLLITIIIRVFPSLASYAVKISARAVSWSFGEEEEGGRIFLLATCRTEIFEIFYCERGLC
jgi:hypothetical protein